MIYVSNSIKKNRSKITFPLTKCIFNYDFRILWIKWRAASNTTLLKMLESQIYWRCSWTTLYRTLTFFVLIKVNFPHFNWYCVVTCGYNWVRNVTARSTIYKCNIMAMQLISIPFLNTIGHTRKSTLHKKWLELAITTLFTSFNEIFLNCFCFYDNAYIIWASIILWGLQ